MSEEHFGITIVEMMAAGLVTIAHASGGPLRDIIGASTKEVGFLASSETEYVDSVIRGMTKFSTQMLKYREGARHHVTEAFGVANFDSKFVHMTKKALFTSAQDD